MGTKEWFEFSVKHLLICWYFLPVRFESAAPLLKATVLQTSSFFPRPPFNFICFSFQRRWRRDTGEPHPANGSSENQLSRRAEMKATHPGAENISREAMQKEKVHMHMKKRHQAWDKNEKIWRKGQKLCLFLINLLFFHTLVCWGWLLLQEGETDERPWLKWHCIPPLVSCKTREAELLRTENEKAKENWEEEQNKGERWSLQGIIKTETSDMNIIRLRRSVPQHHTTAGFCRDKPSQPEILPASLESCREGSSFLLSLELFCQLTATMHQIMQSLISPASVQNLNQKSLRNSEFWPASSDSADLCVRPAADCWV